jgi:NCAIR mutase (PurE)-related protein
MNGQANLDLGRRHRLGMVEAVWGQHKRADQIASILRELVAAGETVQEWREPCRPWWQGCCRSP